MKLFKAPARVLALLMSVSVLPCSSAGEGTMSQREREVARIAGQYVAAHISDFDTVKYPPIVLDHGSFWEVEYQLPENTLGGTPHVLILKNTLEVLCAFHQLSVPPSSSAGEGTMSQREREVARMAGQYVAAHIPDFDTVKYPPIVVDHGSFWEVGYQLPEDTLGGTPHVLILKNTLEVLCAFLQQ